LSGPYALQSSTEVTLGIRPEHVVLSQNDGLPARVSLVEPTGFGIILHLSLHDLPLIAFTLDRTRLQSGPTTAIAFPPEHLHLFDGAGNRVTRAN
jgi:multiple sugar transport system ATP-binding protein